MVGQAQWQEQEAGDCTPSMVRKQREDVGSGYKTWRPASAYTLPPASLLLLKIPQPSQTQFPAGDMSLGNTWYDPYNWQQSVGT